MPRPGRPLSNPDLVSRSPFSKPSYGSVLQLQSDLRHAIVQLSHHKPIDKLCSGRAAKAEGLDHGIQLQHTIAATLQLFSIDYDLPLAHAIYRTPHTRIKHQRSFMSFALGRRTRNANRLSMATKAMQPQYFSNLPYSVRPETFSLWSIDFIVLVHLITPNPPNPPNSSPSPLI